MILEDVDAQDPTRIDLYLMRKQWSFHLVRSVRAQSVRDLGSYTLRGQSSVELSALMLRGTHAICRGQTREDGHVPFDSSDSDKRGRSRCQMHRPRLDYPRCAVDP